MFCRRSGGLWWSFISPLEGKPLALCGHLAALSQAKCDGRDAEITQASFAGSPSSPTLATSWALGLTFIACELRGSHHSRYSVWLRLAPRLRALEG